MDRALRDCAIAHIALFASGIAHSAPVVAPKPVASKASVEIRGLIERLGHSSADIRQIATRRLVKIGAPAVKPVAAALNHRDPEVRYRARLILLRMCISRNAGASTAAMDIVQSLAAGKVRSVRRWASSVVNGMRDVATESLQRQGIAVMTGFGASGELLVRVDMSRFQGSSNVLINLRFLGRIGAVDLSKAKMNDKGIIWLKKLTRLHSLELRETQVGDKGLKHISGLSELVELDLRETRVTGEGLKHLAGLKKLERLHLSDTQLSGVGLKQISRLPKLKLLNLSTTKLTDADLSPLKHCLQLEQLWLSHTRIGDEGLKSIKKLSKLQSLGLSGTRITDAGLKSLYDLKSLKTVWLTRTKVTLNGADALQRAIPNARIRR